MPSGFRVLSASAGAAAILASLALLGSAMSPVIAQTRPAGAAISFHKDVRPVLARRCVGCHQPQARSGKLSMATYAALKSGGVSGPGFVSGKPADSPLFKLVSGKAPKMPPDGQHLTAREQEIIRLWIEQGARDDTPEPKDPISAATPPVYANAPVVSAMAYSPDGELLAVSGYREILLHKADGSGLAGRLVGRSQRIESVAFSPDGKLLAAVGGTSCKFGEIQLWDVATRKLVKSAEVGFDDLYGVSFSPDGKLLACGGAEKSVYVYNAPDLTQAIKFDNHSDWVFGTTFTRDGKYVVSTSRDKAIKQLEIATKNFVDDVNYQVYNGGYNAIARNPLADEVAVGGDEGLIRYYSIFKKQARTMNREDYNLLRTFENTGGPIFALAFSADGSMLAEGGRTNEVRVYKTADGSRVGVVKGFEGSIHSLAWHPKRNELALAGHDGTVRIVAMPSGTVVKSFVPVPLQPRVASK